MSKKNTRGDLRQKRELRDEKKVESNTREQPAINQKEQRKLNCEGYSMLEFCNEWRSRETFCASCRRGITRLLKSKSDCRPLERAIDTFEETDVPVTADEIFQA